MADEKSVRDLIRLVYECSADSRQWPHFLAAYSQSVNAHATGLVVQDLRNRNGNVGESHGFDPFWERRYAEYYAGLNEWVARAGRLMTPGSIISSEAVIPDSDMEKTEFYCDFLRPQSHFHSFGGIITQEDSARSFITSVRSKPVGHFDTPEQVLLAELMPHLQTALRLHHRIAGLEVRLDSASAALDHLPRALIVTDCAGRIVHMNRRAEAIVKSNQGLLAAPDGLRTSSALQTARLRERIARTATLTAGNGTQHCGDVFVVNRVGRSPLKLEIAPLGLRSGRAAVAIFIAEPEPLGAPDAGLLGALLDLTPAEARLAAALVSGKTIKQFSEEAGVTSNTSRTLLKRVFSKTGVSRQADLVRLALTLAGGLH